MPHPTENHSEALAQFFRVSQSIEHQNNGGCLYFCLAFFRWLQKNNLPIETFQIVQYGWNDQIENNLNWLCDSDSVDNADSSSHFTWIYDGEEYDATGVFSDSGRSEEANFVELPGVNGKSPWLVEAFCQEALILGSWNDQFDRSEATRKIDNSLGVDMSDVTRIIGRIDDLEIFGGVA